MNNLKGLLDRLVTEPDLQPRTYCNFGVFRVANAFGCKTFDARPLANTMCDILAVSPAWTKATGDEAHAAANAGKFVLACKKAEGHGHIATVYPAPQMYLSLSLAKHVPFVANIGKNNDIIPVSQAFPPSKGEPDYYIWNGSGV